MPYKILIAEDESSIRRLLKKYFEQEEYIVYDAEDGKEAVEIYKNNEIDLACLDIMMPGLDGFEVAKIIRSNSNMPIILLTALDTEDNILKGYSLLIDDYITKPFNPKVLLAKVKNLLLRSTNKAIKTEYKIDKFVFNFVDEEVYMDGRILNLSNKEFSLLSFLIKNENKICSREMILDELWGQDKYVDQRIIDTYIKNIRKELGNNKYIITVFKKGYKFNLNVWKSYQLETK